jgi:competence protein ComEC
MTLVYLTLAWAAGIWLAALAPLPPFSLGAIAATGAVAAIWQRRRSAARWGAACIAALALGALRYQLGIPPVDQACLAFYNGQGRVTIEGYVSSDPDVRATYTQIEISAGRLTLAGEDHAVRGKAVLNVGHYPAHRYGDRLRVTGLLETPPEFETFSYRDYLMARGVGSVLRQPRVERLTGQQGAALLRWSYARRRDLHALIARILPDPEAGLLSGILLGLDHTLPNDLSEAFRVTGLAHIIVISGYNIALIAQIIALAANRLMHRWLALLGALTVILLYSLFVGLSPPVTRAALMVGLAILAQLLGRKGHAPTSLAIATLVMTAANAYTLWSISFQLSFAATLGLIAVQPWLESRLTQRGVDVRAWPSLLRETLLTTTAAQLATLPVLWAHFRELSLIALPANLLALPVQGIILPLGLAAVMLGAIALPIGRAAGWLLWPFLRYTTLVVRSLGRWSWAVVPLPRVTWPWLLGLAALAALAVAQRHLGWWGRGRALLKRLAAGRAAVALPGLIVILIWSAALTLPDGRLHVYTLDVGQGDAILLRSPGGQVILVDGGPDPLALASRVGQILPFWQRRIALVVATHADQDHLAGLVPILERYRVERVLSLAQMKETPLAAAWQQALERSGAAFFPAARGQQIALGDELVLRVLHPAVERSASLAAGDNRRSIVIQVQMGDFSMLLTGDIDASTERELLAAGEISPGVTLKVAHHGSAEGTSQELLQALRPLVAVISVGADNRFGHPSPEVLARLEAAGCQVFRTDQVGTIQLVTDGQRLWVRPERSSKE